jgi:hypothetical protein
MNNNNGFINGNHQQQQHHSGGDFTPVLLQQQRRPHSIKSRNRSTGGSCISAKTVGTASMTSCSTQETPGTSPNSRYSNAGSGSCLDVARPTRRRHTTTGLPDQHQQDRTRRMVVDESDEPHTDNDDDDDSLHDMLDHMIAESSAKWKSSVQTMHTSTKAQLQQMHTQQQQHAASWSNGLDTGLTRGTITPLSLSRVASVEDIVRKQQEEIAVLRQAIQLSTPQPMQMMTMTPMTTISAASSSQQLPPQPPITHLSIPLHHQHDDVHDELTVDLSLHY